MTLEFKRELLSYFYCVPTYVLMEAHLSGGRLLTPGSFYSLSRDDTHLLKYLNSLS